MFRIQPTATIKNNDHFLIFQFVFNLLNRFDFINIFCNK